MTSYSKALAAYLEPEDRTQAALAAALNTAQPNVNRWANGERFPNAAMARAIESATEGAVPFALWQAEAMQKLLGTPSPVGEAA